MQTHLTLQMSRTTKHNAGFFSNILFITSRADMQVVGRAWVGESLGTR